MKKKKLVTAVRYENKKQIKAKSTNSKLSSMQSLNISTGL